MVHTQCDYTAHPIWTKHVHTSTDVPFGGVNNVSLKFRSQTAKTNFGLMHTTLKRERYKSKHVHNFNTLMLCRSRGNCYTGSPPWTGLVGGLTTSQTNSRRRTAAILNFVKMLISLLDDDICTQFRIKIQHWTEYGQQLQDGFQPTM